MFSIRKIIKEELFNESVKLPIEIGDTVFMGKFKNKKTIVKKIEWNEKGDLMINGKSALRVRIPKKVKKLKEENGFLDSSEEDFEWAEDTHALLGLDESEKYKVWLGKTSFDERIALVKNLLNISEIAFRGIEEYESSYYEELNSLFFEYKTPRQDEPYWDVGYMGNSRSILQEDLDYFNGKQSVELPRELFIP